MPITPKARKDLPDPEATVFDAAEAAEIETRTTGYADTLVTELGAAVEATKQPKDDDLTAIAALTTQSFGRELLTKATAAAVREALALGSAALQPTSAFDTAGAAAAAQAASQPLDSDLSAIAALSTTEIGRSLLAAVSAAAIRTISGAASSTHAAAHQLGGSDALALPQYDNFDLLPYIIPMGLWPGTTIEPTAKRAYWQRFTVPKKRPFKFVRYIVTSAGSGEDKVDVGIYGVSGAKLERLGSSGAIKTTSNATGVKALELTGTVNCEPGTVYFVSMSWETKTGTPAMASVNNNSGFYGDIGGTATLANRLQFFKGETFPLPSSAEGFTAGIMPWLIPSES